MLSPIQIFHANLFNCRNDVVFQIHLYKHQLQKVTLTPKIFTIKFNSESCFLIK